MTAQCGLPYNVDVRTPRPREGRTVQRMYPATVCLFIGKAHPITPEGRAEQRIYRATACLFIGKCMPTNTSSSTASCT